jgi:hypothetical protein
MKTIIGEARKESEDGIGPGTGGSSDVDLDQS